MNITIQLILVFSLRFNSKKPTSFSMSANCKLKDGQHKRFKILEKLGDFNKSALLNAGCGH